MEVWRQWSKVFCSIPANKKVTVKLPGKKIDAFKVNGIASDLNYYK